MKLHTIQCERCHSNLVVTVNLPGQAIRCANCRNLLYDDVVDPAAKDRGARWSLWLGLSSVVAPVVLAAAAIVVGIAVSGRSVVPVILFGIAGLMLPMIGLPALWLGIRSLLRMRHHRARPGDRRAAIAGTILGGMFGVVAGMIFVFLAVVLLVTFLTLKRSEDPTEIMNWVAESMQLEIPDEIKPVRGTQVLNVQSSFEFADHERVRKREIAVTVVHFKAILNNNRAQFINALRRPDLGYDLKESSQPIIQLDWEMGDQPIKVAKSIFSEPNNDRESSDEPNEVVRYLGYISHEEGLFGIVVLIRQPNEKLGEEQVRQMFASLRPAQ